MVKISVVINTWNEEKNLPRALASIRGFADEIVVVDMESTDATVEIAKKAGAKVYSHKPTGYVEPARNYAINKATGDWILVLDADEELPAGLSKKLRDLAEKPQPKAGRPLDETAAFYRLPRKNLIFGQWIRHSRWWPDYNIRFFKKGSVFWSEIIHRVPETHGRGKDLPGQESFAIVHHEYESISQYISRMDRYTNIQAINLVKEGYEFSWRDLLSKPTGEFLSRFFFGEAYKDGVHGLALSLLQAFSEISIYLKVWELEKFKTISLDSPEIENEFSKIEYELNHWLVVKRMRRPSPFTKLLRRALRWKKLR